MRATEAAGAEAAVPGAAGAAAQAGAAGGGKPWWRSAPRVAIIAAAVVAAVIVTMVLTRPSSGTSEVFAEPAASTGQDPVTKSTANDSSPTPSAKPRKPSGGGNSTFEGATPGLYGGTRNSASCDVEKQITYLTGSPERNQAFAGVLGKKPGQVPSYLRSLTPLQLAYDTRVTNHGFKDGKATAFQSVLQAGTAVMVDSYGVPRVRCKCGNPLTEPTPLQGNVKTVGTKWPGYEPSNAVVVKPAKTKIKEFVLRDPKTGKWFKRPEGSTGTTDTPTAPPDETPSGPTTSESPPNGSPSAGEHLDGAIRPPGLGTGTASPGVTGGHRRRRHHRRAERPVPDRHRGHDRRRHDRRRPTGGTTGGDTGQQRVTRGRSHPAGRRRHTAVQLRQTPYGSAAGSRQAARRFVMSPKSNCVLMIRHTGQPPKQTNPLYMRRAHRRPLTDIPARDRAPPLPVVLLWRDPVYAGSRRHPARLIPALIAAGTLLSACGSGADASKSDQPAAKVTVTPAAGKHLGQARLRDIRTGRRRKAHLGRGQGRQGRHGHRAARR